jgi:hypothetical protein
MNLAESIRADRPIPCNVPPIRIANVRAEVGTDIDPVPAFGGHIDAIRQSHHP